MKAKLFSLFLVAASLLLSLSTPQSVRAADPDDLIVDSSSSDPNHFRTIQAAIERAKAILAVTPTKVFSIRVKANPTAYRGPITAIGKVPIIGESTEGTFIEGATGAAINVSGISEVLISNFTFRTAQIGISVENSSSVDITNNIFLVGRGSTAVQVRNSGSFTSIINNTFFNNGTAISTNSNVLITNNIFNNNRAAISGAVDPTLMTFNDFYLNEDDRAGVDRGTGSIPNQLILDANPDFVDPGDDFHLLPGSPAAGSGNPKYRNSFDNTTSDMGAYGGPSSDNPRLLPAVTNVSTRVISPTSIEVSWSPISNNLVTAYRVYYRTSSDNVTRSVVVAAGTTSTLLSDLLVTPPAPLPAPTGLVLVPLNQALQASWSPVSGATKYLVYYGTQSFEQASLGNAVKVDAGNTTSFPLGGLTNLTPYFVAVSAQTQATVSVRVTAIIDSTLPSAPGGDNESPLSQEAVQGFEPTVDSPISPVVKGTPEAISPYPNLPNEGCFIATAAFGFYSAPQVQLLREFRDRYLLTNPPGKAFVAWYYNHGPRGAQFINAHPWLKLPVRVALLPLIAMAMFLLSTTPLVKLLMLSLALLLALYRIQRIKVMQKFQRKMLVQNGGSR